MLRIFLLLNQCCCRGSLLTETSLSSASVAYQCLSALKRVGSLKRASSLSPPPPSSNCDGRLHGTWFRPVWQSPDLRVESCLLAGSFLSSCPAGTNPFHPYVGASFSVSSRSAYKVSTAAFVVTPASDCGAVKCASSFLFAPVSAGAGLSRFSSKPG